jgi:hypothetical protein
MKLRLLIIPALMATAMYAQGPGGFSGHRNASTTPRTPPTPEQLAGFELNRIATVLRLTPAQTSTLSGSATLVGILTNEQTTLQGNAAALKTDWTTAEPIIVAGGTPTSELNDINTRNGENLAARVTAAAQVLTILPKLGITLTTQQQGILVNVLVHGGGPGGFHGGHF